MPNVTQQDRSARRHKRSRTVPVEGLRDPNTEHRHAGFLDYRTDLSLGLDPGR